MNSQTRTSGRSAYSLKAMEIVRPRSAWSPVGGRFGGAPDVREFVKRFDATTTTVIRVEAVGSAPGAGVVGDWFCDSLVDRAPNFLLPRLKCSDSAGSERWFAEREALDAWLECRSAPWLLRAASDAGVTRQQLVLAACACAHEVRGIVPSGDRRASEAIKAAEGWARGVGDKQEVKEAADEANEAHRSYYSARKHAEASACLSACAAAHVALAKNASEAGKCASEAGKCAWMAMDSAGQDQGDIEHLAKLVRQRITTSDVLRVLKPAKPRRS